MTIQFQGHVDKIEGGMPGMENITFIGQSYSRSADDKQSGIPGMESGPFTVAVPKETAKHYRPGDPIQVTIIPLTLSGKP